MDKVSPYAKFKARWLRWLLRSPVVAVAMHWTVQSLLYMDRTERWFKIALDLAFTMVGGILLGRWLPRQIAWVIAFLLAHTLNFLLNGQLWGVLKHYGMVNLSFEEFALYVNAFRQRAAQESSIDTVLVYGSLSRQGWSPSSDLDARIVRHSGLVNGMRACWFLLRERSRALVYKFPLDVYIVDSQRALEKLRVDEEALPLHNYEVS